MMVGVKIEVKIKNRPIREMASWCEYEIIEDKIYINCDVRRKGRDTVEVISDQVKRVSRMLFPTMLLRLCNRFTV